MGRAHKLKRNAHAHTVPSEPVRKPHVNTSVHSFAVKPGSVATICVLRYSSFGFFAASFRLGSPLRILISFVTKSGLFWAFILGQGLHNGLVAALVVTLVPRQLAAASIQLFKSGRELFQLHAKIAAELPRVKLGCQPACFNLLLKDLVCRQIGPFLQRGGWLNLQEAPICELHRPYDWGLVSAINLIWPFFYLQVKIFGLGANCQKTASPLRTRLFVKAFKQKPLVTRHRLSPAERLRWDITATLRFGSWNSRHLRCSEQLQQE